MKSRILALAFGALLVAAPLVAQTRTSTADPVSGTWTGHMEKPGDAGSRMAITVTMKLAGKTLTGEITGPPSPGVIESGAFDRATGALTLEVIVQDSAKTPVHFAGKVVKGTASGTVALGGEKGVFSLNKQAAGAAPAATQTAAGDAAVATARKGFAQVSAWVTKAAELVPADKYSYRPAQTVRTFGQLVAHIADSYTYFCGVAAGRQVQWTDAIEKQNPDKATLAQRLKQATDACTAVYSANGKIAAMFENVAHTNLHYGNIITYMRMLGLVPPSSM